MIDPGHGGKDAGCSNGNITEKELTLTISKQLATELENKGYHVTLTREEDRYLRLDERSTRANQLHADLFLSIHVNSSSDKSASGIETFCLSNDLFKHTHGYHRKTQASAQHYHDVRTQLYDRSTQAAQALHQNLIHAARTHQPAIIDRSIQYKVPQVLFGVHVPAVMVELGFLSNKQEAALLTDKKYQKVLVHGLADGVDRFFVRRDI